MQLRQHLTALLEVEGEINRGVYDAASQKRLLATCDHALAEYPESGLAQQIKRRLLALRTVARTEAIEVHNSRDTIDLVTGKTVVNLPLGTNDQMQIERMHEMFNRAHQMTTGGRVVAIRNLVETYDKNGPCKGLLRIFSPAQIGQLDAANNELCKYVLDQVTRFYAAHHSEQIIQTLDRTLERDIAPVVDAIQEPETRRSVQESLALWRANRTNPWRNRFHRTSELCRGREYAIPIYLQNPAFFSISLIINSKEKDAGVYSPRTRNMLLPAVSPQVPYDFFESWSASHELSHVRFHTQFLQRHAGQDISRLERCQQVYFPSDVGIIEDECEAFGNMIEIMYAKTGSKGPWTIEHARSLGVPVFDQRVRQRLNMVSYFAEFYFKGGGRKENHFPDAFVEAIRGVYEREGRPKMRSLKMVEEAVNQQ